MRNQKGFVGAVAAVLLAVIVLIVIVVGFGSWTVVSPGDRAVVVRLGNINRELESGFHFKMPLIERIETFDIKTQKDNFDVTAASKDLQNVYANIAVNYNLDVHAVSKTYAEVGKEYVARLLAPAVHESIKASTAQFSADQLITRRAEVKDTVFKILSERLGARGIIVTDVSIVDFKFSDSFEDAIENKVTAEQNALAQKNQLEKVKYEAEQRVVQAQAEAESIRIQAQAVTSQGGEDYVKLQWIQKWDGKLPATSLGEATPMIQL